MFPEIDIVSGNQFEGCFDALPAWPPLEGNIAYNPVPDNSHLGEIPQDFSWTSPDPASTPHINDTITPMNFLAAWKTDTARLFPFFAPFTPPVSEASPNLEPPSDLASHSQRSPGGRKLAWQSLRYLSQLSIPEDTQRLLRLAMEQKLDLASIFLSGIQASIEAQDGRTTLFNLGDLFVTGLQIVNTDKQRTLPSRSISRLMTPDLESNCFKMLQVPLIDAFLCCAEALGLTADRFYDDYCSSPFYNPEANASNIDEIRKLLSKGIPRNLRPTNEQITHIHHPFLDLIPFPSVRSKALIMMSYSPPRFDYWGFKKDIGNHGMICWQTDRTGSADPTDGRSWEGEPWFLKKWWSLFGGEDGELWESTTWWRRFRGEPLSVEDLERNDILTPPSWRHRGFDKNRARD